MRAPSALEMVELWDNAIDRKPHARLTGLVEAMYGPEARGDTLGMRNRRLVEMHQRLFAADMEAVMTCAACDSVIEFVAPTAQILAIPPPETLEATVIVKGRPQRYRLPVMRDLEAVAAECDPADAARRLLERCRCDGEGGEEPDAATVEFISGAFESLDAAAVLTMDCVCSECGAQQSGRFEVASFLVRDVERAVNALVRDVDQLARAYGWSERAILELPSRRRRRYVEMITASASNGSSQFRALR